MIESTTGIILRTRPLTETSLVVHWLTPDFGRIATAAKGARRPQSPFLGRLDLFYLVDFAFSRSRRSDLHTLREVGLREMHGAIREDISKLNQAAYAAAFIEQATETETPLPVVFELLRGFLGHLCRHQAAPEMTFAFELKLLREIGLQPDWDTTRLAAGTKKIAEVLTRADWRVLSRLKPARAQAAELRRFLHGFLIFHLGRLPRGRAAALAEAD
jgi:DNA repair protein RecO (recombination protein O)